MDLSMPPFDCFNSLFTLTCSTTNQLGLSILKNLKLSSRNMKLKLKGLTVFHRHKIPSSHQNKNKKNNNNRIILQSWILK